MNLLLRGLAFAGVLACLDGYMNIAMEQTEEYVNGQLKNKYGDTFIRGNNGEKKVLRCNLLIFFFLLSSPFNLQHLCFKFLFVCLYGCVVLCCAVLFA